MRADVALRPKGPSRKLPAWRSSSVPKTLGASKLGTHSQSIAPSGATSALVWQSDRNAYSAMGGKGDGAAALRGMVSALIAGLAGGAISRSPGEGRAIELVGHDVLGGRAGVAACVLDGCGGPHHPERV